MEERGSVEMGLAFLLGAVTGAAAGLLFAPRAGRETREMVGNKIREGAEFARQAVDKGRRAAEGVMDRVRPGRGSNGEQGGREPIGT